MRIPWQVKRAMQRAFARAQKQKYLFIEHPGHEDRADAVRKLRDLIDEIAYGNVTEVPYDVIPSKLSVDDDGRILFELFEAFQDLVEWLLDPVVTTEAEIRRKFSAVGQRRYQDRGIDIIFPHRRITPAARRAILAQDECAGTRGSVWGICDDYSQRKTKCQIS